MTVTISDDFSTIYLTHSVTLSLSLSLSLYLFISFSLSFSLPLHLFLSLFLFISFSLSLSLSLISLSQDLVAVVSEGDLFKAEVLDIRDFGVVVKIARAQEVRTC